ncbi:MAG: hypothetical protein U9Q68_11305, partial [Euryarchaeota archaeon]|nr:hypothetical protein [Euryarchaeota archaeon]
QTALARARTGLHDPCHVPGGAPLIVAIIVPVPVWVGAGLEKKISLPLTLKSQVATQHPRFTAATSGLAVKAQLTYPDPAGSAGAVLACAAAKCCSTAVDMVLCIDTICAPLFACRMR